MKLRELKSILYSQTGNIQWAIVYDLETNTDIARCSIEGAVANYGGYEVKRITSYADCDNHYLVITI